MADKPNIAELVEQLPPTDKEIEARKAAEKAGQEAQKPPAKETPASKFTGPEPDVAARLCEEVLAGGRESLIELIALVRDPASPDFKDYKPEYLLHCLTLHVGRPGNEAHRRLLTETLTAELGGEKLPVAVKGYLVRELQWTGGEDAIEALGRLLTDEALCDYAAAALAAIGGNAVGELRKALPKVQGRCRLVIVQSLATLRDAKSTNDFKSALADPDRDVRLAAAWGLARIGDATSVPLLIKAADVPPGIERIKATQASLLLAEHLVAAGKKQEATRIYTHLRDTRTDPKEAYVREAAVKALSGLAGQLL